MSDFFYFLVLYCFLEAERERLRKIQQEAEEKAYREMMAKLAEEVCLIHRILISLFFIKFFNYSGATKNERRTRNSYFF